MPVHLEHGGSSLYSLEDTFLGKLAERFHAVISSFTLLAMTLFISLEVVTRYIFNNGLQWSQEACCICLLLLVAGCQANCWQKDRHIRMDLIYNNAPQWFRRGSDMLTIFCGAVFFGTIAAQALKEIPYQLAINEATDELRFPFWLLNAFIVFSFLLLLVLLTRFFIRSVTREKRSTS